MTSRPLSVEPPPPEERSRWRTPFIVTVAVACGGHALLAGVPGCGGKAVLDGSGSGGAGGAGGASNAVSTNSTGVTVPNATVQTAAVTSNTINCPAEPPGPDTSCEPGPGACNYEVKCQSGTQSLSFDCPSDFPVWTVTPTACTPCDSCPGTSYYCDGGIWVMPQGSNPPSPCPTSLPMEGSACQPEGMGAVWNCCGYLCSDVPEDPWGVAVCNPTQPGSGVWSYEGACGG